jgi:hypothetical protein
MYMKKSGTIIVVIAFAIFLFPQQSNLSKNVNAISEYLAFSGENGAIDNKDIELVDSLWVYSIEHHRRDISESLLTLTFTTVPYNKFPVTIPLLGIRIDIPLISAEERVFIAKNKNLPRKLFFDTPDNDYGDKDKLAHFFGSAFLAYNSFFSYFAHLIGYFVEAFEESFNVQSEQDMRDIAVNYLGIIYGNMLKKNNGALPSSVLVLPAIMNMRITL